MQVCSDISGDRNIASTLETLLNKDLLISCIDERQGIYRYHNILGEYLRTLFSRLDHSRQVTIHRRAASSFSALGDEDESLRHLLITEDYNEAMNSILKMPSGPRTMSYMGLVPIKSAVENIDFAYQKFFYHYINLEFDKCRELYNLIITLPNLKPGYEGLGFLINDEPINLSINLPAMSEIECLPIASVTKALLLIKNAAMLHYKGEFSHALEFIAKAMSYPRVLYNPFIACFAYNIKSQISEEMGYFVQATVLYGQIKDLLDNNKSLRGMYPSYYIGFIGINLRQLKLDDALLNLELAKNSAKKISDWDWFNVSYSYNVAEYLYITGEHDKATEIMNNLFSLPTYSNLLIVTRLLRYSLIYGCLSENVIDRYIQQYEGADDLTKTIDSRLLYAQIQLYRKQSDIAFKLLDSILVHARKEKVYLKIVEAALIKLSIIFRSQPDSRAVLNLLFEAVHYASGDNIMLPFHLHCVEILDLDRALSDELLPMLSDKERDFYEEILKICGKKDISLLSARELEVLQEIAGGYSNKQIAEHLCISLATVKTHIINIYGKLQVNSRVAAADAGRRLGLI